jgi:hypothetical protein
MSIVVSKLNNIIYLEKNCHCKYFLILFFSAAIIPEFTSGLRKCHAQQGKNAKFECEVSGTPTKKKELTADLKLSSGCSGASIV